MINLVEGQLEFGAKKICAVSDLEDLDALAGEGIIEKKTRSGQGGPYFHVESNEDGRRFGISISLQGQRIEWLLLRWLNGPCTGKDWDGVSEKALKEEYRLLSNYVEKRIGAPPNINEARQRTWHVKWGKIEVSYEPRDFVVAIFLIPR